MGAALNLTGKVFSNLTVISKDSERNNQGHIMWLCKCECGNEKKVSGPYLVKGNTKSCGCLQSIAAAKNGKKCTTHGQSNDYIYYIWRGMKKRCELTTDHGYENYGGRGIKVCDDWANSFENFYRDMGERPSLRHSIERVNNDGNYEPNNCIWADPKAQGNNRRTNTMLSFHGKILTLAQWSDLTGIKRPTIYWRYKQGWTPENILSGVSV